MRHRLIPIALGLPLIAGGGAWAQDSPVVVELFTSQGCASCPPADRMLADLVGHPDVLPLALHVDYWDYIGWSDTFADPAYTIRQKGYARAGGVQTIYTPQLVVNGIDHVVGAKPMRLMDLIEAHGAIPDNVDLDVVRENGALRIEARAQGPGGPYVVQVVAYDPMAEVAIPRGENSGKVMTYVNIVTDWEIAGEWDGAEPIRLEIPLEGPGAVLVQQTGHGEIVAAARVD